MASSKEELMIRKANVEASIRTINGNIRRIKEEIKKLSDEITKLEDKIKQFQKADSEAEDLKNNVAEAQNMLGLLAVSARSLLNCQLNDKNISSINTFREAPLGDISALLGRGIRESEREQTNMKSEIKRKEEEIQTKVRLLGHQQTNLNKKTSELADIKRQLNS